MNAIQRAMVKIMGKRSRPMMENTYAMVGDLCKAFYQKDGSDALPIITEISSKSGIDRARIVQQMMTVKDMKDVGELFQMMDLVMDMGMEIVELSDDAIHFIVPRCLMRIDNTSKELCEAMMNADTMLLSTLLGQGMKTEIVKSVAAGDSNCEIVISKA